MDKNENGKIGKEGEKMLREMEKIREVKNGKVKLKKRGKERKYMKRGKKIGKRQRTYKKKT